MALIHCPECSKEISDKVKSCPHCRYPIEDTRAVSAENEDLSLQLIAAVCPRCGANLEFNRGQERYFCSYCGSEVIIKSNGSDSTNAEKFFKAAQAAFGANNVKETIALLTKTLEADPDHYKAVMLRGVCIFYSVQLQQLRAEEIISYFELSREKFMQTNPGEEEKMDMFKMYGSNLLTACTKMFSAVQQGYIASGPRTRSEFIDYWSILINDLNLASYLFALLDQIPIIFDDKIAIAADNSCDLIMAICDELRKSRSTSDLGASWLSNRGDYIKVQAEARDFKEKVGILRKNHQEDEYRKKHPEEYKLYQEKKNALINERDEQYRIIESNKNKLFGNGAKDRKAAEAKLKEILNSLENLEKSI
jgi:DNA-directed RNA polymerase subunit RPC12/RpoP